MIHPTGVHARTGALAPEIPVAEAATKVRAIGPGERGHAKRARATSFGRQGERNHDDVADVGWAIVVSSEASAATRRAVEELEPLVDHRRRQAGELFKKLEVAPHEDAFAFIGRLGGAIGSLRPSKLPLHILLVGSPEEIPFSFQHALDIEYSVGRLHFDDETAYGRYAAGVVAYERMESPSRSRTLGLWGPSNGDEATRQTSRGLIRGLAKGADDVDGSIASRLGVEQEMLVENRARRGALLDYFGNPTSPAVVVTASHGNEFDADDGDQRSRQGGLIAQEWEGGPVDGDVTVDARAIDDSMDARGLVAFLFACFGAGTPVKNEYVDFKGPAELTRSPFVAALPQRLLGLPMPALGVIGHVDRAWCFSFEPSGSTESQLGPFETFIGRALTGKCLGNAMSDFNSRGSTLTSRIDGMLAPGMPEPDAEALMFQWMERNDARAYVLLGDPAVKLRPTDALAGGGAGGRVATRVAFGERPSGTRSAPPLDELAHDRPTGNGTPERKRSSRGSARSFDPPRRATRSARSTRDFTAPPVDSSAGVAPDVQVETRATCHFKATMDDVVPIDVTSSVEVLVSREEIEAAAARGAAAASGVVDLERKIVLQAVGKKNFAIEGVSRIELDVPEPGVPVSVYFDVRGTTQGDGEIWIVVRQGPIPLVTLHLAPTIGAAGVKSSGRVENVASAQRAPPSRPLAILEIRELLGVGTRRFQFDFDLHETGGPIALFESKPLAGDKEAFVDSIYESIEARWIGCQRDAEAFAQELREIGGSLWSELLPPELQKFLWEMRSQIDSVIVVSAEPFIPWEILHFKEPDGVQPSPLPPETMFLGQRGLVRWLHQVRWPPETITVGRGRVHCLAPQYVNPDWTLANTARERDYLVSKLGATVVDGDPVAVRAVLRAEEGYDLFHFAGHGMAESSDIRNAQIMVGDREDPEGYVGLFLAATAVAQGPRVASRPMVVLNACQAGRAGFQLTSIGGFATAFLTAGAGAFISSLWSVGDEPAQEFCIALYDAMKGGDTLSAALTKARKAARLAGDATWMAYTVYGHPDMKLALG